MALLTDQIQATGVSLTDLIHIVITGDTSQNPAGSSFKASISQLVTLISGATGTSGTSGSNGSNGSSGTSGTRGSSGSSGTTGSSGSSGSSGTTGTSGSSGSSGTTGTSGSSGSSGTTGSSGSSGSSGTTGSSGTSGSSGTGFNTVQTPGLARVLTSDGTSNGAIAQSGLTYSADQLTVSGLTYTSGITSTSKITFPQKTINSSYTMTDQDFMIDVTGGTFNVQLLSAVGRQGRIVVVKNNGGGAVTVVPYGSETIDLAPFVILGETNSLQLVSNGSFWVAMSYNISTVNSSTGVFEFSGLTKASNTTFNVAPVKGWIVDDTTNPLSPQLLFVYFTGGTYTDSYVTTAFETFVYLTSGATIGQQSTPLTEQQRRQNIFLGKIGHPEKVSINLVFSQPDFVLSPLSQLRDMFTPINLINGGVYPSTNGANLKFNTSAGFIYGLGINFASNTLSPNALSISGTSPCTFQYRTQTGGTVTNVTDIDPLNYDVGGTITPVTGTKATNQRIFLLQNGTFRVQYGQTTYNTLALAIEALQTETFTPFPNFVNNAVLIGILTVLSTATDLTDTSKARFFFASKFGETVGAAGGVSTTNLQQAYNNSVQPEITTNSTLGAFSIKNGTGNPDVSTNLLEGIAAGGPITSYITAKGEIVAGQITSSGLTSGDTVVGNVISATTVSATTIFLSGSNITSSWTPYTPVWTASGTNPVIGNGTIEGWYKVIGKTCFVRGNIAMGSTTTFGTGEWYVSMPFTAVHADAILMTVTLLDNSSAWYNATMAGARAGFNTKAPMQYVNISNGTASDVNATQPFTWTTSDRFLWNGSYEIA